MNAVGEGHLGRTQDLGRAFRFFFPKTRSCTYFLEKQIVTKANLPLQGNEFRGLVAPASSGHEVRTLGFVPGALGVFVSLSCDINR